MQWILFVKKELKKQKWQKHFVEVLYKINLNLNGKNGRFKMKTIKIPLDLHIQFKILSKKTKKPIRKLILEALIEFIIQTKSFK